MIKISALALPSVAIVILNYNGKKYLEEFLPTVINSSYSNKKIIVADNGSTDSSIEILKENFPSVDVISFEKNFGFTTGYNKALKQIEADYYVLLNSDVEVTQEWIEPVIALMESDKKIAVCQPKILSYNDKKRFEYAGASGGWIDYLGYPFARGRLFDILEEDVHQYDDNCKIFWASGAALFVKSKLYHEAHGLDDRFFAHMEEIDLCWRLQRMGYEIMVCPSSIVYHVGGGTLPKGHRKTYLNFRNNLIMLCKNMCWQEKLWKLPLRLFLDNVFAWKSLLSKDAETFKAVIKAHIAVLHWSFSKKTLYNFPKLRMRKLKGVVFCSIVWQHFVHKKNTFREILQKCNNNL